MKYYNKIEWILDYDDFLISSPDVVTTVGNYKESNDTTDIPKKALEKIINNQIKKKIKNSKSVKGVCTCNTGILCTHRKKYLKGILHG